MPYIFEAGESWFFCWGSDSVADKESKSVAKVRIGYFANKALTFAVSRVTSQPSVALVCLLNPWILVGGIVNEVNKLGSS